MAIKPSTLKGTRDFLPEQVIRRNYIFDIIRSVFERYGYRPIETPAMEKLDTLTGKYGEEGDRLIFKILNNGDFLSKVPGQILEEKASNKAVSMLSKRALRYDLTVPFARFVVQHRNDLQLPFKRYQIQPVWRADRPQKGRYQEFYQCDVDVVGSASLMYEAELIAIYAEVFEALKLPVTIRINNRKILAGIAEVAGIADRMIEMTVALDKLDKIGAEKVAREMTSKGIANDAAERVLQLIQLSSLEEMQAAMQDSATGVSGIRELQEALAFFGETLPANVSVDFTLARGLNYYTGFITEVTVDGPAMGSIGGGGRYDDLTGVFGMPGVSGVGISFGAERIYDAMEELGLFPASLELDARVIVLAMDADSHKHGFTIAQSLRKEGISTDIYPEPAKFKKQMKYADQRGIPFALIIGEEERNSGMFTLKDLKTGQQTKGSIEEVKEVLKRPSL